MYFIASCGRLREEEARASATSWRSIKSASAGVSTPGQPLPVTTTRILTPFSSARNCSSASARSSGDGFQRTKRRSSRAGVAVDSLMPQIGPMRLMGPISRNDAARKIERVAVRIDDHLHLMRRLDIAALEKRMRRGNHFHGPIAAQFADETIDQLRISQRLIALDVENVSELAAPFARPPRRGRFRCDVGQRSGPLPLPRRRPPRRFACRRWQ